MKIKCWSCVQPIEYGNELAGTEIDCPSCQALVFLPAAQAAKPSPPPEAPKAPPKPKSPIQKLPASPRFSAPIISMLFLTLVGFGFIYQGSTVHAESAIHQIYAALYIVGGFALVGLAALINAVSSIAKQLWERLPKN